MNDNRWSNGKALDENLWASILSEEGKIDGQKKNTESAKENNDDDLLLSDNDWDYVNSLLQEDKIIECEVIEFNQGGLIVKHEMFKGFIPVSHLDNMAIIKSEKIDLKSLKPYVGKMITVKVIDYDPARERIVLSERAAQTSAGERNRLFGKLEIGSVLQGNLTNITGFGVFVDLGGVEGLVHISELSWQRVKDPKNMFKIAQKVNVKVLDIGKENGRVSLSIKRLLPNPWENILKRFPEGEQFTATVIDVVKFGAFVRLDDGLEGLIHISEMKLMDGVLLKDILAVGEQILVELISVDVARQRMSLRLVD